MYKFEENKPSFPDFYLPFGGKLSPANRWVKRAAIIPWELIEKTYAKNFKAKGAGSIPARVAFGSLFIKEFYKMSDREVVESILENPYLQYFLGYKEFLFEIPFDHSMLTHFRKRFDFENFTDSMNEMIAKYEKSNVKNKEQNIDDMSKDNIEEDSTTLKSGKLIIDATCLPADIAYPTDVGLLNKGREHLEKVIDILYNASGKEGKKPRTYRKVARKKFLGFIKKKKPKNNEIREMLRKQLGYINRNLGYISNYIENDISALKHLKHNDYKKLLVINELYKQQREMFIEKKHSVNDRIVSISQPHVRPIVRGKARVKTEFGMKVSASIVNGYTYFDRIDWNAYHEGEDLKLHIQKYKERHGCLPESIHADRAYGTRANRKYCKDLGIRFAGISLGRPKKNPTKEEKQLTRKDEGVRVEVEGKFGVLKRRYSLDIIMSKLSETSITTALMGVFVMNAEKILKDIFLFLFQMLFWHKNYNFQID